MHDCFKYYSNNHSNQDKVVIGADRHRDQLNRTKSLEIEHKKNELIFDQSSSKRKGVFLTVNV